MESQKALAKDLSGSYFDSAQIGAIIARRHGLAIGNDIGIITGTLDGFDTEERDDTIDRGNGAPAATKSRRALRRLTYRTAPLRVRGRRASSLRAASPPPARTRAAPVSINKPHFLTLWNQKTIYGH